jgi:hypothetical protein
MALPIRESRDETLASLERLAQGEGPESVRAQHWLRVLRDRFEKAGLKEEAKLLEPYSHELLNVSDLVVDADGVSLGTSGEGGAERRDRLRKLLRTHGQVDPLTAYRDGNKYMVTGGVEILRLVEEENAAAKTEGERITKLWVRVYPSKQSAMLAVTLSWASQKPTAVDLARMVIYIRKRWPDLTQEALGDLVAVSKSRVCQLLKVITGERSEKFWALTNEGCGGSVAEILVDEPGFTAARITKLKRDFWRWRQEKGKRLSPWPTKAFRLLARIRGCVFTDV